MSRETYTERREREAISDRIQDFAWEVAENTASGEMVYVERSENPADWPRFKFSGPISGHRCECGMEMAPLPTFNKKWGILPTWFCLLCNLEGVVAACERIKAEAMNSHSRVRGEA